MTGFLIAYTVIAGVASKGVASWSVGHGLAHDWFGAFKMAFVACFVLLWLGHAIVW